jgi:hypothetical protein
MYGSYTRAKRSDNYIQAISTSVHCCSVGVRESVPLSAIASAARADLGSGCRCNLFYGFEGKVLRISKYPT